jgi:hypothetical protein
VKLGEITSIEECKVSLVAGEAVNAPVCPLIETTGDTDGDNSEAEMKERKTSSPRGRPQGICQQKFPADRLKGEARLLRYITGVIPFEKVLTLRLEVEQLRMFFDASRD